MDSRLFILSGLFFVLVTGCQSKLKIENEQSKNSLKPAEVFFKGSLMDVMKNGNLSDHVDISSLPKKNLMAVGPLSRLTGEVTVIDGTCYVSTVKSGIIITKPECAIKTPFLVWSNPESFIQIKYQKKIGNLTDLNEAITSILANEGLDIKNQAIPIKISGRFKKISYHVVDLEKDFQGKMNHQMHTQIQKNFTYSTNEVVELMGFFSQSHQGIFLHHGENLHFHFLSPDKILSGHVDNFELLNNSDIKLFFGATGSEFNKQ